MLLINIFNNLDISRERINNDSQINLLIRYGKKSYDVSIEIENGKFLHFCTCPHRSEALACSHAGAVLLFKMIKKEKNKFNTNPKDMNKLLKNIQKYKRGINFFKEMFPIVQKKEKKNMIYFNFEEFNENSQILKIQRGVIKNDGSYSTPMKFTGKDFNFDRLNISKNVSRLLSLIITGENYGMGNSNIGFSKNRFYDVSTDSMMPILKDLFLDEPDLIIGVTFAKENFHIRIDT